MILSYGIVDINEQEQDCRGFIVFCPFMHHNLGAIVCLLADCPFRLRELYG